MTFHTPFGQWVSCYVSYHCGLNATSHNSYNHDGNAADRKLSVKNLFKGCKTAQLRIGKRNLKLTTSITPHQINIRLRTCTYLVYTSCHWMMFFYDGFTSMIKNLFRGIEILARLNCSGLA